MTIQVTPIPRLIDLAAPAFTIGTSNVAGSAVTAISSNSTLAFLATQAEMEAASSTSVFATPGNTQYHPGVVKSWVSYDYDGGTPTAMGSYNVASLGDDGTGHIQVNYTTALSAAHGGTVGMTQSATTGVSMTGSSQSTTSCDVYVSNASHAAADIDGSVIVCGDQ